MSSARVIETARGWLGTPYHDQASRKGIGCDCLGLARGVWRELIGPEPVKVPRYSRDWGEVGAREVLAEGLAAYMVPIPLAEIRPGAVVLFRMRESAIAKHCGILTDEGAFVHSYHSLGVIEEPLTDAWRRRITFAFLYPQQRDALRKTI
ncbi:MAG: C40 family peptidase [Alphaproteobacteria bacterium]|nr:C40 family peptidase [Alphaproteobacteria bacterium]